MASLTTQALKNIGPRALLRAHLGSMEGAFSRVAQWLLQLQPEEMDMRQFTTGEIAKLLGTSRATIVRLCQYLGYEGFTDFKAAWIQESSQLTGAQLDRPLLPTVAAQVAEMTIKSTEAALKLLDVESFEKTVNALCDASTIMLYGYADSYFLALSVEHKLTRGGKQAKAFSREDELLTQGQFMKKGDVVIVISQSGARVQVLNSIETLRSKGCIIVVVTSQANSLLAHAADYLLLTSARDVTVANRPVTLRAPQTMVLDMLLLEMVNRIGYPTMQLCEPKLAISTPSS